MYVRIPPSISIQDKKSFPPTYLFFAFRLTHGNVPYCTEHTVCNNDQGDTPIPAKSRGKVQIKERSLIPMHLEFKSSFPSEQNHICSLTPSSLVQGSISVT